MGIVKAVCTSDVRGVQKSNVTTGEFCMDFGIKGDAHGGKWHRQVSLLSYEKVEKFNKKGAGVEAGAFGENLVVAGIDFQNLPIGSILQCNSVVLEITQIGKECHQHCQIYEKMGECIMPTQGVFAKVVQGGKISVGDEMTIINHQNDITYTAAVITLSDQGFCGARKDESGSLILL